jgi:hypothetical protein
MIGDVLVHSVIKRLAHWFERGVELSGTNLPCYLLCARRQDYSAQRRFHNTPV